MGDSKKTVKIADLVEDFALYPRTEVDGSHVALIADYYEAGGETPPPIVEPGLRIVDGFHRVRARRRIFGDDSDVEVIVRTYKNEAEMYLDAARLNASHGKNITGAERTACIIKGIDKWKLEPVAMAEVLGITVERVEAIVGLGAAKVTSRRVGRIAVKGSVRHLVKQINEGKRGPLTNEEVEKMDRGAGTGQALLLAQVCDIIESEWLDLENPRVVVQVRRLRDALDTVKIPESAKA
jgi:hypothetical protein